MKKLKQKYLFIPIIAAVISVLLLASLNIFNSGQTYKKYVDFQKDIASKNVSEIYVTNSPNIKVQLKSGKYYMTDNPRSLNFKESMLNQGVKVSEQAQMSISEVIPSATLAISILAILILLIGSTASASKSLLKHDSLDAAEAENNSSSFKDMAGNEEAIDSVMDVVDFLQNPVKYTSYGARMPKGIILYGEPGTGKTLLAKAIAGEANVPFYAMSGSDFIQVYVGVGASRIRQLFKKARTNGKAIIFIDEIDAIGKKRDSGKGGGSDEGDQTLNALLTEMSGFNEQEGIVVIAATNRLDMLDSALLRPGRFDRHIEVTLPDISAREKILNLHLRNKPAGNINTKEWAQKTVSFSGAKLESLLNEAAIIACKESSELIDETHIDKAFSIVLAGYEKNNRDYIRIEDTKVTAFHEAGHALVSMKILPKEKISKVTIIPTTKGAGGYTLSIPEDRQYQNKDYLYKRIMVLLAGRAAEEITFGKDKITTGAYSDIKAATNIVSNMITEYGMGDTLGLLSLHEISNILPVSSEAILNECKEVVNKLYEDTKFILNDNSKMLDTLSNKLIKEETLYSDELNKLVS